MSIQINIINENDHFEIEYLAKRAFWNINMPGCDEHYLVHRIWNEPSFIPEISLVAKDDKKIVGVILYTKCRVETENGDVEVLTFGPLCVDPMYQKNGIGANLLKESISLAKDKGYIAILICGVPTYYPKFGFKTADTFGIKMPDGSNFEAFMGYELQENSLLKVQGKFYEPDILDCDIHDAEYMKEVEAFDQKFPPMERKVVPGQWR